MVRRKPTLSALLFCVECGEDTQILKFDARLIMSRQPLRDLIRRTESGAVHTIETATGQTRICRRSLVKDIDGDKKNENT